MGSLSNLLNFLKGNALEAVLVIVGLILIARSHKQDHKGAMGTVAIALMGLMIVGIAVSGTGTSIGSWLAKTIFS